MRLLLIVGAVLGLGVLWLFLRSRSGNGPQVRVDDVPDGVAHLQQQGKEDAFLVFIFVPPTRPREQPVNLQFSIERGQLGLDWVLLSPTNIADKAQIETFIRERGHSARETQVNGVRYLRVEDGDLAALEHRTDRRSRGPHLEGRL